VLQQPFATRTAIDHNILWSSDNRPRRLANFHIGGEWLHLTPGVRAVIETVIADNPE